MGGDLDRRIALIGFDNTIEIAIDTFMNLCPDLREGYMIPREVVSRAKGSFHEKLRWFEAYIADRAIRLDTTLHDVRYYHALRNALYHSGNGMVPEMSKVEGARAAVREVLAALFGETALQSIDNLNTAEAPDNPPLLGFMSWSEEELEETFLDYTGQLEWSIYSATRGRDANRSLLARWRDLQTERDGVLSDYWANRFGEVLNVREIIRSGRPVPRGVEEFRSLVVDVMYMSAVVDEAVEFRSVDLAIATGGFGGSGTLDAHDPSP